MLLYFFCIAAPEPHTQHARADARSVRDFMITMLHLELHKVFLGVECLLLAKYPELAAKMSSPDPSVPSIYSSPHSSIYISPYDPPPTGSNTNTPPAPLPADSSPSNSNAAPTAEQERRGPTWLPELSKNSLIVIVVVSVLLLVGIFLDKFAGREHNPIWDDRQFFEYVVGPINDWTTLVINLTTGCIHTSHLCLRACLHA